MNVLYVRVSSIGQNNERQIKEGFDLVFSDVISGTVKLNERPEGKKLIKLVNEGKVKSVTVHSIDRLGRNLMEILSNIEFFTSNGVCVICEKEGIKTLNEDDTVNQIAKLIVSVLGSVSEMGLTQIKERTLEGIENAKLKGVYLGRAKGSEESIEKFMNKAKTNTIIKHLNNGESIRRTALLSKCSVSLVQKVVKLQTNNK